MRTGAEPEAAVDEVPLMNVDRLLPRAALVLVLLAIGLVIFLGLAAVWGLRVQ